MTFFQAMTLNEWEPPNSLIHGWHKQALKAQLRRRKRKGKEMKEGKERERGRGRGREKGEGEGVGMRKD